MRDGHGSYDGLILQQFKDGGLTLFYMSSSGWIEDNGLISELHDTGTVPIDSQTARDIAHNRFSQPLDSR